MKIIFRKKNIPLLILCSFGILIFLMGILNHYFFRTVAFDYGNYNFAFWDYSHFRITTLPSFNKNFLQDHFSFTLMYFVPLYWLLNWLTGTYTLILIQCCMIIVAAWYTYKTIRLKSDNIWLSSGVLIYYFVILGRYTTFLCDVNLAVMSSCFIPIFIYYFEVKKYGTSVIILLLALLSRENIPLWFIFIYIVLLIQHRTEKKAVAHSLAGITISLVYFVLLFKILIPAVESPHAEYSLFNYSALGSSPSEAISFIIQHPFESAKLFFINHSGNPLHDGIKLEFYWVYIVSGGFILFLRPQYLIWFIPIVAQKVLNDSYIRWGIGTYYAIEVATLLPLSVFLTLSSLKSRKLQNVLILLSCTATIAITAYKFEPANNRIPWLMDTSKVNPYSKDFYSASFDVKQVNKLLKQIPKNAKVSASNVLLPHLAQRAYIYYFPKVADAEYLVLSVFDNNYLHNKEINDKEKEKYLSSPDWEVVGREFPVILLKKNANINLSTGNILWSKTDTISCNFEQIDFDKKHVLLSNNKKADTLFNVTSKVSRNGKNSICLTKSNPYSHSIQVAEIEKIAKIKISVWCKSEDKKGFIVFDGKNNFYKIAKGAKSIDNRDGWRKVELSIWVPQNPIPSDPSIYFWNSGSNPVWFDDLSIVTNYK